MTNSGIAAGTIWAARMVPYDIDSQQYIIAPGACPAGKQA
jgi:hypothetical protein